MESADIGVAAVLVAAVGPIARGGVLDHASRAARRLRPSGREGTLIVPIRRVVVSVLG